MTKMKKTLKKATTLAGLKAKGIKSTHAVAHVTSLERKLVHKEAELLLYKELLGGPLKNSSFTAKLDRFVEIVLMTIDADVAAAFRFDEEKNKLELCSISGPLSEIVKQTTVSADDGIAAATIYEREPILSKLKSEDVKWLKRSKLDMNREVMTLPFKHRRKVTGVLQIIGKPGGEGFLKLDVDFIGTLTRQFTSVAEWAYVFTDLDDRVRDFSTLNQIGTLLISTLNESIIRRRAMNVITKLLDAEVGSLLLLDKENDELYFEVALGKEGAKVKEGRLKMGEGIAGWVAKTGEPVIVNDVHNDKRYAKKIDKLSHFTTRNILCVPIKTKDEVIGVLQAINKHRGPFLDRDLDIFQIFAGQVAIALDNARLHEELRETFMATSESLAEAIEKRDTYTGNHTKRVLHYSVATAKRLKLTETEIDRLRLSSILHDVGKIGIDDAILRKEAPLDEAETAQMKRHPTIGAEILDRVPQLRHIIPGTLYHHERIDGLGYPNGFKDEQIPLIARIIAVADTYDAMTTSRPYRKGLPTKVALAELKRCSGTQFDPIVVKAFIRAHKAGEMDLTGIL
ncbi:MAG: HD domain-containing phosphohydrolase [Thermodesulfobacteriota bacterium]